MWRYKVMAILVSAAVASISPAYAASVSIDLTGSGINASINMNYLANPNAGILQGTSPNSFDPIGSYIVSGVSGTFSDSNIGISGAAITGIVASNPSSPHQTNLLAPHSFGFYPIASGVPSPEGIAPGLSYDNLYYPSGSPQTATDYPFHGGLFDIYGIIFTLSNGDAVNLWSNGDFGTGPTYGVGVTDGAALLDYASPVMVAVVPEPASWIILIAGFGFVGCIMRRRRNAGVKAWLKTDFRRQFSKLKPRLGRPLTYPTSVFMNALHCGKDTVDAGHRLHGRAGARAFADQEESSYAQLADETMLESVKAASLLMGTIRAF